MTATTCPRCGADAVGNFCEACGAPRARRCAVCDTTLPAGARFCPDCGASLGSAQAHRPGSRAVAPWLVVGFVGLVAMVAGIVLLVDGRTRAANAVPLAAAAGARGEASDIDLSTMSPREAADRLFNRVMTAQEAGDLAEVERFTPMAIGAYDRVGTLDPDAHYHLALLHLAAGDPGRADAEAVRLAEAAPGHLLGAMIRASTAQLRGDDEAASRARAEFLGAYESEMAQARQEYQDHQSAIDRFRERLSELSSAAPGRPD